MSQVHEINYVETRIPSLENRNMLVKQLEHESLTLAFPVCRLMYPLAIYSVPHAAVRSTI